jgi:50S ribosomal protein L16 3-hydroxylase
MLGDLDPQAFLEGYWQKRPLLKRGAFAGFDPSLTPEELAGLACSGDVEARIVVRDDGGAGWRVDDGPFDAETFGRLPDRGWTLLVQAVDRRVPGVARLLDTFRFLPNWRVDDVMVSYAESGGGVGPHVDAYDVFLIQGSGRRRWSIETTPVEREELVPDVDLRLLARFEPDASWVLEPGDVLYLPPGIAHDGVALEPCMTYSVGFRAPGLREMLADYLGHVIETTETTPRYIDPDLRRAVDPGEIDGRALSRVREMLREALEDERRVGYWFGCHVTRPRREVDEPAGDAGFGADDLVRLLRQGATLRRSAISHFGFIRRGAAATLFVGGRAYELPPQLAPAASLLCGPAELDPGRMQPLLDEPRLVAVLVDLCRRGFLDPEPGE